MDRPSPESILLAKTIPFMEHERQRLMKEISMVIFNVHILN